MSVLYCSNCKRIVSGKATRCSKCGKQYISLGVDLEKWNKLSDVQKRDVINNRTKAIVPKKEERNELDTSNMVYYDPSRIEILRRLKKYPETYECTCLECGYKGPMGVISHGDKGKKAIAGIIAFGIIFLFVPKIYWAYGLTIGGMLLGGFIIFFVESKLKANQKTLYCPNCEKILYTK